MHERYVYRTIRIERGAWPRVRDAVAGPFAAALTAAGGSVFGLWAGEIGFHNDEGILMTAWPPGAEPVQPDVDGIIASTDEVLDATVRPRDPTPPAEDGLYAHRWFELAEADWPEFLELSDGAWPSFEDAFPGIRIVGFFRAAAQEPSRVRVLLLTRYPDLATWERSRLYAPQRVDGAQDAMRRFLRRHRLTDRTIVRLTRPVEMLLAARAPAAREGER